jgi:hypothetical protein
MAIEFILLEDNESLFCKGHLDPTVAIEAATDYLRHIGEDDFEDSIEEMTPEKVRHTIARCVPLNPHDPDYGYYAWILYTHQKPGRGAFKATIIDL